MVKNQFQGALCLRRISIATVTAAMLLGLGSPALGACETLRLVTGGIVAQVTDGDTVVLDSGLVVRMIGTQAPKLPLGREGFPTWPLAPEARAALEALALGRNVTLGYGGEEVDRYDRALAQVFVETGADEPVWAQAHMVRSGLARVYSFPDNRQCLGQLYVAEAQRVPNGLESGPIPITACVRRIARPSSCRGAGTTSLWRAGYCWPTAAARGSISISAGTGRKTSPW
jgi:micrococcal nuclease